jgi:DNA-binding NarL/FixJ family response regulator
LALDGGRSRQAVELVERLLRQARVERRFELAPALAHRVSARVVRGELGEACTALGCLRELERLVGTGPLRASRELAEGLLEAASGDHERARTLLEDAVDRFERFGAPFEASQARIELAMSLTALGRTDQAEREATTALRRLVEIGADADAERARRVLAAATCADEGRGGLARVTHREREVLGLLAEGLTNRQIAERLVVSEHTVHRHVTNILGKLELPSRTAAAAYALRSGLIDSAAT